MKNLIIAFVLALAAILASFLSLTAVGVDTKTAGTVVSVLLGGIPYIHTTLEKRLESGGASSSGLIVSLEGFGISCRRLALYGCLLIFAATQFSGFIGGLVVGATQAGTDELGIIIGILAFAIAFPLIFFIGRWMGIRSASYGMAAVIIAAVLGRLCTAIFDFWIVSPDDFKAMFGKDKGVDAFVRPFIIGSVVFSAISLIGYWRGRKRRLSAYLHYLLKGVPVDSKEAIIDLAFQEAARRNPEATSADDN